MFVHCAALALESQFVPFTLRGGKGNQRRRLEQLLLQVSTVFVLRRNEGGFMKRNVVSFRANARLVRQIVRRVLQYGRLRISCAS